MIKERNLIYIQEAVRSREVVRLVETASRAMSQKVRDITSFEHTCYVNIGKEISNRPVKSIKAMAIHYIKRAEAHHVKKSKYQHFTYFDDLTKPGDEGQAVEYEPRDDLAIVGSGRLELKETITLLAKSDRRRELILTEWMNGNTNDTDISDTLARVLGGQARSHRIFVQRFRTECRTAITVAI